MPIQTVSQAFSNEGVGGFSFRNKIINGAMEIDQRATSVTTANWTVDRFYYNTGTASKGTAAQSTTIYPTGFNASLGFTSSSAYTVGSSDYFGLQQPIEGLNISDLAWGSASAKTVTLSFWVRSSLTGTFGGSLRNSAANRSYVFSYTISAANTWEYKTVTITGDTSGTWLTTNGVGIFVHMTLAAGSNNLGTAGSWSGSNLVGPTGQTSVVGTNGATFYITGVQLEVGSVATPFERRPYGTELVLCQRYYAKIIDPVARGVGTGQASGGASRMALVFPTTMRATPSFGFNGTFGYWNGSTTRTSTGGFTVFGVGTNQFDFDSDINSAFTVGDSVCMYASNNSSTWISLSAEL